jgi:very-short-patch-repair endonuclease
METDLHLRVSPHASRFAERVGLGTRVHWNAYTLNRAESAWLVPAEEALARSLACLDEEHAIAALESAVHEGYVSRDELRRVCARAPGRLARAIREIELTSDSGLETIVRRRLRHAGYQVVAQGFIPGVGRQDLVVEDVVGLEVDGGIWHAAPAQWQIDRERDIRSVALGRGVIRLPHNAVLLYWETSLSAIARAVADARDLRRYRGR